VDKIELVDNWRRWPYMFSQWCNAAGIAGITTYSLLPVKLQDALPPNIVPIAAAIMFALGFIGRLFKQKRVSGGVKITPKR
jgi:hypothetical protein